MAEEPHGRCPTCRFRSAGIVGRDPSKSAPPYWNSEWKPPPVLATIYTVVGFAGMEPSGAGYRIVRADDWCSLWQERSDG